MQTRPHHFSDENLSAKQRPTITQGTISVSYNNLQLKKIWKEPVYNWITLLYPWKHCQINCTLKKIIPLRPATILQSKTSKQLSSKACMTWSLPASPVSFCKSLPTLSQVQLRCFIRVKLHSEAFLDLARPGHVPLNTSQNTLCSTAPLELHQFTLHPPTPAAKAGTLTPSGRTVRSLFSPNSQCLLHSKQSRIYSVNEGKSNPQSVNPCVFLLVCIEFLTELCSVSSLLMASEYWTSQLTLLRHQ